MATDRGIWSREGRRLAAVTPAGVWPWASSVTDCGLVCAWPEPGGGASGGGRWCCCCELESPLGARSGGGGAWSIEGEGDGAAGSSGCRGSGAGWCRRTQGERAARCEAKGGAELGWGRPGKGEGCEASGALKGLAGGARRSRGGVRAPAVCAGWPRGVW